MHEHRPSQREGDSLPPAGRPEPPHYAGYEAPPQHRRGGMRTTGGLLAALAVLAAKAKSLLALAVGLKWLVFAPKLLLGFGSLVLSIWFYALIFGWKFGLAFVLLILVHELGHYLTFRNLGISANLPFFIPGFGAFVQARGPAPSLTAEAVATLAGPVYGLAAAACCYGLALRTGEPFWFACAYVGFFLNALNLLPVPPFDGGGIAGAIDPRLWIVGAVGFLAFVVLFGAWSPFAILLLLFVAFAAVPRLLALRRGIVDPRFALVPRGARLAIAAAYFVTAGLAVAGAAATYVDPRHVLPR